MILQLENITGAYTKNTPILKGLHLTLNQGEVLAVIGQNGTGKSTLAKAIINILPYRTGKISYNNNDISKLNTKQLNELGIVYFMQGGRIFPNLSVKENLSFANLKNHNFNLDLFPTLKKHWLNPAGLLSGGERHQLALAMALIKKPTLLILDEPSAGLSPVATQNLYYILEQVKKTNISILLIEQNVNNAISFSDKVAVMQQGVIANILNANDKKETLSTIQALYF